MPIFTPTPPPRNTEPSWWPLLPAYLRALITAILKRHHITLTKETP